MIARIRLALEWVAESRLAAAALLAGAVLVRLLIAAAGDFEPLTSELQRVAVSMAETGRIAGSYGPGSGLTTHTGPLSPALAAGVYHVFGSASLTSEVILTVIVGLVVGSTALVLNSAFRVLGTPGWLRGMALLFVALLPLQASLEAQDLRARESAIAALIVAGTLLAALKLDQGPRVSWRAIIGLSLLVAFLFVLSPVAGVAAFSICGILGLRKIEPRRWLGTAAIAAAALVSLSAPWALRNQRAFGEMVWTRGNFGLEYAIGTNPESVSPRDPAQNFRDILRRWHPFQSAEAFREMEAVGELQFARNLKAKTDAWVSEHPGEAARIWLRHIGEFYCPPAWLWNPYGTVSPSMQLRAAIMTTLTLVALLGLGLRLFQRRWRYLYIAMPIIVVVLPYILLQPRLRYRYVISSLLLFLAFDAVRFFLRRDTVERSSETR